MPRKINEVRNYNATFVCDETRIVKVSFTPFAAVLENDGLSTDLTQQPAADGFLYTDGRQSLRARGNEATWTDSGGTTHQCRERTER
jgi:membrane-bound inhibitor of C-type lysozyme